MPQASIVGMMPAHYPDYTVVRSDSLGLARRYPMTWQVRGPRFAEMEQAGLDSVAIDQTLHRWLGTCTPEQRRVFVNTQFAVL